MKKILPLALTVASIFSMSTSASALDVRNQFNRTRINDVTVGTTILAFMGAVAGPGGGFCQYRLTTRRIGSSESLDCNVLEKKVRNLTCSQQSLVDVETALRQMPAAGGCSMFTTRTGSGTPVMITDLFVGEEFRFPRQADDDRLEGVIVSMAGVDYDYDLRSP